MAFDTDIGTAERVMGTLDVDGIDFDESARTRTFGRYARS